MVNKQQLDESLAALKTSLTNELKDHIKVVVDESISALRENIIQKLLDENKSLKEKVTCLEKSVRALTLDVVDGQQYTRQNNLVIGGIPKEVEHDKLMPLALNIANHCIGGKNVGLGDFEACHRVSAKSTDVVCRFVNRRAVEDTLRNWKKLDKIDKNKLGLPASTGKIYVSAHLSPYRAKIAYFCRQLKRDKRIEKLSTLKGNVKIRLNAENEEEDNEEARQARWKKIVHLDELVELFGIDVESKND